MAVFLYLTKISKYASMSASSVKNRTQQAASLGEDVAIHCLSLPNAIFARHAGHAMLVLESGNGVFTA